VSTGIDLAASRVNAEATTPGKEAQMRAHTIATTARTIVPAGILTLSLAVVLLTASASTASAKTGPGLYLWCAPLPVLEEFDGCYVHSNSGEPSFDFGDRKVGTTSPARGFALVQYPPYDTFNPEISVSGDFAQTNANCPPTLSVPSDCLISVTFAPTGTGPTHGTLSTGPGGPKARLTGRGVTRPTPPVLPLRLNADGGRGFQKLGSRGVLRGIQVESSYGCILTGCPKYDSTLVVRGDVKKTTRQLVSNDRITFKARLKHLKRLKEKPTAPTVKIKFAVTDEFGQTVTEQDKVTLCSRLVDTSVVAEICRWNPSRK
jgi:hypothetical protein